MRIAASFLAALGQIGDPSFARVLALGVGLTVALLAGFTAIMLWTLDRLVPETFTLPLIGTVGWLDDLASGASVLAILVLSIFVMVPVASAFSSFFLDDVTDAVEAKHYPALPPAPRLGFWEGLGEGANFLAVLILANMAAFAAYLLLPPLAPLIFLALNGFLLGREYFQLIAARRLGRAGAKALRRRHAATIWLAGALMALPLLVPVVNLLVPVIGAATFTHLYHRLPKGDPSARTSRNPAR